MISRLKQIASIFLSAVLLYGDMSFAIENQVLLIPAQNCKLSPVSEFSEEDIEAVREALREIDFSLGKGSPEDQLEKTAFLYGIILIARTLTRHSGDVREELLKEVVKRHIGGLFGSKKVLWSEIERDEKGVYRLSISEDENYRMSTIKTLCFYIPGEGKEDLARKSCKVGKYEARVFLETGRKVTNTKRLRQGQEVFLIRRNRESGQMISAGELVVRNVLEAPDGNEVILQVAGRLSDTAVNAVHSYFGERGERLSVEDEILILREPKPAKNKEHRPKRRGKGFDPSREDLPGYAELVIDKKLKADFTAGEISKMIELAVSGDINGIRAMPVSSGDDRFGELVRLSFIKLAERIAKLPDGERSIAVGILRSPHNSPETINSLSIETARRGISLRRLGKSGRKLGRASARYFDDKSKKASIVLDRKFVKALMLDGNGEVAAEILAERIAHELAHDNKLRGTGREQDEETRVIVHVDIPLFKSIKNNSPLRKSIEEFRSNNNLSGAMHHSGRYFKMLEEWSNKLAGESLFDIVRAYVAGSFSGNRGGKAYPAPQPRMNTESGVKKCQPGSIADIFNIILADEDLNSPDNGISLEELARRSGVDQADVKRALALLVRNLKIVMSDTGHLSKDAKYYVPESVRLKSNRMTPLLSAKGFDEPGQEKNSRKVQEISQLLSFEARPYHDNGPGVPENGTPITPGILVAGMKNVLGNMDALRSVLSNGLEPYSVMASKSEAMAGNIGYAGESLPGSVILSMVGKNREFVDTGAFSSMIKYGGIGFVIDPSYAAGVENGFFGAGRHLSPGSYYRSCYQGPHGFLYNSMLYRGGKRNKVPFDAVTTEKAIPRGAIRKLVLNRMSRSRDARTTFDNELKAVKKMLAEEFPLAGITVIDEFGWVWYEQSAFSHDPVSSRERMIDGLIGLANDKGFRTGMNIENKGMDENELRRSLELLGPLDGADMLFAGEGVTVLPLLALLKGAKSVTIVDAHPSISARWEVMKDLFRDDFSKIGIELTPERIWVREMNMVRYGVPIKKFTHVVCLNVFNPMPHKKMGDDKKAGGLTLTHGITREEDIETVMEALVQAMSEDGCKFYCSVYDDGKGKYEDSRAAAMSVWIRGFIESKGFSARRDEECYAWKWNNEDLKGIRAFILDLIPVTTNPGGGERYGDGPDILRGEEEAGDCGTAIRSAADKAKDEGQKIIIGIDTGWIPDIQLAAIQPLLNRLSSLGKIKGLDNIVIRRRNDGAELARVLKDEAKITGTPLSNVIILGSVEVLGLGIFDDLRKPAEGGTGAFFANVDLPDEPLGATEIKLLRMIEEAVRKAMKPGEKRECRFYLRADPVDLGELEKLYKRERDVLAAA